MSDAFLITASFLVTPDTPHLTQEQVSGKVQALLDFGTISDAFADAGIPLSAAQIEDVSKENK